MSTTLYYFYHRGRAEIIRLVLAAAGVEYREVNPESRGQFLKWIEDGRLMFGQVPMLDIDGKQLVQSGSIVRYVAKKDGSLMGKSKDDEVKVDMLYEAGRDLTNTVLTIGFEPESAVLDRARNNVLPKALPMFDKHAAANESGFMVGDSLTIADISLLEGMLVFTEYLGMQILDGFPALKKWFDTVTSQNKISSYLNGPRRPKKNDDQAIAKVKEVLGWAT